MTPEPLIMQASSAVLVASLAVAVVGGDTGALQMRCSIQILG